MDNLILTGWGWKEYAVSAAVTLRALNGQADVMGMSKRRLSEFLELEGRTSTSSACRSAGTRSGLRRR